MPRPKRACRASPAVSSVWPGRPRERRTDEEIVAYLNAALEEGEPTLFLVALGLGNVARARGLTEVWTVLACGASIFG